MDLRSFENLKDLFYLFREISSYIKSPHLDFGCGDGLSTAIISHFLPDISFISYDIDKTSITRARRLNKIMPSNPLNFTYLFSEVEYKAPYSSVSLNFVFHEAPDVLEKIFPLLKIKGKVCVLDYNMKRFSERDFRKRFRFDNEKKIIETEGFENCYRKHTAYGLEDCTIAGEKTGFRTFELDYSDKYFLWIGER